MKTGVVRSAEIRSQRGRPLAAGFWLNRQPGETFEQWKHRTALAQEVADLRRHLEVLQRRHPAAWAIVAREDKERAAKGSGR